MPKETVLNILTSREINLNGKLFKKLIRKGYKYVKWLSGYLEHIETRYEWDPLADFHHPALIPPLSVLTARLDIIKRFPISVKTAVIGGMSLFTLEKNKRSALRNLIEMNNPSYNLCMLIRETWECKDAKV